ncbi:MAG: hypothetical protein JNM56_09150 [Planctomycetia bacterium]|nr:hypothetical protein [Planctomycetia bacterium]
MQAWFKSAGSFLLGSLVFALVYTQAPLYYSNQNQYFLHGLADGGLGLLHADWLANTLDPTPLFSLLVSATYRFGHTALFYAWYALLFGVYYFALSGVFRLLLGERATPVLRACFALLFLGIHAGALRFASGQLLGVDYPWYFQAGLAGQYILGPTFQPSAFGVLLLLSIYLFLAGKPWQAIVWACAGATIHTTYLFSAACLTLAYMFLRWRDGAKRASVLLGGLALLLVLPIVFYNWSTFGPSSPSAFAEAQQVLARFRIPHHCVIGDWFDWVAGLQVAWIVLAMVLARRHPLAILMLFSFVPGTALTLVQLATGNDTLSLLFPWRVSVYLVPLATTVVLAKLLAGIADRLNAWPAPRQRLVQWTALGGVGGLVLGGVWIGTQDLAYPTSDDETGVLAFVQANQAQGGVYLIPFDLPRPRVRKGAFMNDFVPPTQPGNSNRLIRIELQRFRLHTGAPIFIDFKSIPYRDVEVLEWQRRVQTAQAIYKHLYAGQETAAAPLLQAESITHVVMPARHKLEGTMFRSVFDDGAFAVYRISTPP